MTTKVINWKNTLYIIALIVGLVFVFKLKTNNMKLNIDLFIDTLSLSIAIISPLSVLFCKILWKLKIFRKWMVLIPNLNGKWEGVIDSTAIDFYTHEKRKNIKAELTVKQTLFSISCIMKTNEMTSRSISAGFIIDEENQQQQFIYTYQSIPKQTVQYLSPMHFGTVLYDFDNLYQVENLEGNYWTGRGTSGSIKLIKRK